MGSAAIAATSSAWPASGACPSPSGVAPVRSRRSRSRSRSPAGPWPLCSLPRPSNSPVTRPRRAGQALLAALVGLLPPAALAQPSAGRLPGGGCRVVVDYRGAAVGDFPAGWQARDDAARATYRVTTEAGLRFVRATADGTGSQMGREFVWDAGAEPILTWRWRPRVFPAGSDERDAGRYDSALAVYAVFGSTQLYTRAVKYIWSRVVPVGTTLRTGRTPAIVLRSGPPADEEWVTEAVHVRRDYDRLHGEAPARARGVGVLTDSDQTRSRAVGDYGEFRVCRDRTG